MCILDYYCLITVTYVYYTISFRGVLVGLFLPVLVITHKYQPVCNNSQIPASTNISKQRSRLCCRRPRSVNCGCLWNIGIGTLNTGRYSPETQLPAGDTSHPESSISLISKIAGALTYKLPMKYDWLHSSLCLNFQWHFDTSTQVSGHFCTEHFATKI